VHAFHTPPIIMLTGRHQQHLEGAATIQVPCASLAPPRPHLLTFIHPLSPQLINPSSCAKSPGPSTIFSPAFARSVRCGGLPRANGARGGLDRHTHPLPFPSSLILTYLLTYLLTQAGPQVYTPREGLGITSFTTSPTPSLRDPVGGASLVAARNVLWCCCCTR